MEILHVENVSKKINDKLIIDDISFNINEKEIVGFIGPNGSGKTTTLRLVTNLIYPTKGQITICNHDVVKEREKALQNVASIIEYPPIYPFMSGIDHLKFIASIRKKDKKQIQEVTELVGLEKDIKRRAGNYSLGMKQRLGLGMSILAEPKLLILDEPTNGLDPTAILELRKLLQKLNTEKGMTIFFSSHNLTEIAKLCHRIIFLKNGKIVDIKNADEVVINNYQLIVDQPNKLIPLLEVLEVKYELTDDRFTFNIETEELLNKVLVEMIQNNIKIKEIHKLSDDMESLYQEVYEE